MLVQQMSCMGGFKCEKRDSCNHYHARSDSTPFERLCVKGGFNMYQPRRPPTRIVVLPKKEVTH